MCDHDSLVGRYQCSNRNGLWRRESEVVEDASNCIAPLRSRGNEALVERRTSPAKRAQESGTHLPDARAAPGQLHGFAVLTLQEHCEQSALRESGSRSTHGNVFPFG